MPYAEIQVDLELWGGQITPQKLEICQKKHVKCEEKKYFNGKTVF